MFIATLFVIFKKWKQATRTSIEKWIKKMQYIYAMQYSSGIKNKDIKGFANRWMKLENIVLSVVAQLLKDMYNMFLFISLY